MSENQEKWKADMKAIVGEVVDQKLKEWKLPTMTSPPSSEHKHDEEQQKLKHEHFKLGDDICPDCYPSVKKAIFQKEFKDADAECDTCGLLTHIADAKKEDWECPNCGGKYAKRKK